MCFAYLKTQGKPFLLKLFIGTLSHHAKTNFGASVLSRRMTSSCLAGSWRWSQPTWRKSCGSSTSLDGPGPCANRLCLLRMPWRGTLPMWWRWLVAKQPCWPSSATRQFTATSTKFRSTTSVSSPADSAVSLWGVFNCFLLTGVKHRGLGLLIQELESSHIFLMHTCCELGWTAQSNWLVFLAELLKRAVV